MSDEHQELRGLRVLIVEDAALVADDLAEMIADLGCVVIGPAGRMRDGLRWATGAALDGALLDVNLADGETSFPIARALAERAVPFIFLSGYDLDSAFPEDLGANPRLPKPVQSHRLAAAMAASFAAPRPPGA